MEHLLLRLLPSVVSLCELMGLVVVALSALRAFWRYLRGWCCAVWADVKFEFANGLATALEFKMAAEILKTVLVRSLDELIVLAAIIVLRALLSFLIHAEMCGGAPAQHKQTKGETE